MALQDLATEYMLQQSRQPTHLSQYFEGKDKREADRLNQQVTLSNLATAEQNRSSVGQEMEQSGYKFELQKQRMQQVGQLVSKAMAEPDKEKQYAALQSIQGALIKHGADSQEIFAFQKMLESYSPSQEYGYQEEAAGLGLDQARADIASTKADVGLKGAQAGYYASGGGRGGRGTYKAPPLIGVEAYKAQAKPFIENLSLRNEEDKKAIASHMYQGIKTLTSQQYGLTVEEAEARARDAAVAAVTDDGAMDVPFFGSDKNKFDFDKFQAELVKPKEVELSTVGGWQEFAKSQGKSPEEFTAYAKQYGMTEEQLMDYFNKDIEE